MHAKIEIIGFNSSFFNHNSEHMTIIIHGPVHQHKLLSYCLHKRINEDIADG